MNFTKKKLENGLTVLFEKRDVPVTTVMLATKFGSIHETAEDKGIAHFIEHLCFKGTKKRTTRQIAFELEKVGGILNAFTSEEETAYYAKLSSQHLELAMDVIFDIFFNPIFPEEEINKEGKVICEEIKMYNDDTVRHTLNKIKSNLYESPFGMDIIGTKENIEGMSRDVLMKKHNEVYTPQNAILSVVGNNDIEEIIRFAEKFSVERPGKMPSVPKIIPITKTTTETRKDIQQANVVMGLHFPKSCEKDRYAAEVLATILGHGMSSRLFTEVREKRGLAYAVKTSLDLGKEFGYMIIYAGTDKNKVKEVMDICIQEFKKMKDITEKELQEGKEHAIGNHVIEAEGSNETAVNLLVEEISGDARNYYAYEKNINSVKLEDIKKLAGVSKYSSFALTP
ncbi:MAG: pitrilysin family protein [archaeon]